MAQKTRVQSMVPLLILLAVGLAMPGCESAVDPMSVNGPPTSGWLAIESGAEGASAWVLVTPDGAEITGTGDSLLADPVEGDYWLLWEPVEAWKSPKSNPDAVRFTRGSTETFEASYVRIEGGMGDVVIDVGPSKLRPAWNVFGPDGFFAAGKGSRKLPRREVGEYRIVWDDEPGYRTPPESAGQLLQDSELDFLGIYEEEVAAPGTIQIDPEPNSLNAGWSLSSASGGNWSGNGDATLNDLSPDDYTITWAAVDGYDTPVSGTFALASAATLVLRGTYSVTQIPLGTIEIDANPDALDAPWQMSSASGGNWTGNGDQVLTELPLESYTITWGGVAGYLTPGPASGELTADTPMLFQANYVQERAPVGTVVVNPDPDSIAAGWTLVSSLGMVFSGSGDSTLVDLPIAEYGITWGNVLGYLTPPSSIQTLVEGGRLEFAAIYQPAPEPTGTVYIDPNPDSISAPWQLESDLGALYTGAGDSTLVELPLGTYTLTWGDVEGYETPTPNPVSQTLTAGGTAVFALE